eukprot:COSAG02_NODE_1059_length_14871_cov_5.877208_3_plen_131_part_00
MDEAARQLATKFLHDALSTYPPNLERVRHLLREGSDPNAVRYPGGEESCRPDTPLKAVMFCLSNSLNTEKDHAELAKIADELLNAGAEPGPAMDIAQLRYGQYRGTDDQKTWHFREVLSHLSILVVWAHR